MSDPPAPHRCVAGRWIVALLALAGLAAAWLALRHEGAAARVARRGGVSPASRDDGAALYDSPFLNARPGVQYVGDAACARCHAAIAEPYRQHPMGRSLMRASADEVGEAGAAFEAHGLHYVVERKGDALVHREERRDGHGNVVAGRAEAMAYAIGSGRGGRSYLFERDGFVFESPISWFTEARRWDLSPGYRANNEHFERVVTVGCLYCHANRALPVAGSANRYRAPIFEGLAIGCERCHGPGALHVQRPGLDPREGRDLTIVNPRHLNPARRDSVCQQCHLKGDQRVLRAGREQDDFRPGLPLARFWSVFFRPEKLVGKTAQAVGHVEQLESSRCYESSGGAMGCISCHDPHERPAPEERVTYFRGRCLECHAEHGCALPEPTRRARQADDSCTACHMPRTAAADIAHAATTLHRIPRRPDDPPRLAAKFQGINPERDYFVHYHRDQVPARGVARDRAVALARAAWADGGSESAAGLARAALPALEAAARGRPPDLAASEHGALCLWLVGRPDDAAKALRALVTQAPERENPRWVEAGLLASLGRRQEAVRRYREALERDPWPSVEWFKLANLYAVDADWRGAEDACRQALRANFAHLGARRLLAETLLRQGAPDAARAEFARLLAFDPPNRAALVTWFESLPRSARPGP